MKASLTGPMAVAALMGAIASIHPAKADLIFSFPAATMYDGILGDPVLTMSGSFSVPTLNTGPLSGYIYDIISINLVVMNGAATVATFTDPEHFMIAAGTASGLGEVINVDSLNFYQGITIENGLLTSADYVDSSGHGYNFEANGPGNGPAPGEFVTGTPIPVTESSSVDEPAALPVIGLMIAAILATRRKKRQRPVLAENRK